MSSLSELHKRYNEEYEKWKEAGYPLRSRKTMVDIHEICKGCPHFIAGGSWLPGYDKCGICECNLHPTRELMNKIAWATTKCPDNPPKWDVKPTEPAPD